MLFRGLMREAPGWVWDTAFGSTPCILWYLGPFPSLKQPENLGGKW